MYVGLRERLHVRVRVGARACTREAARACVCVWVCARARLCVRACICMHDLPY